MTARPLSNADPGFDQPGNPSGQESRPSTSGGVIRQLVLAILAIAVIPVLLLLDTIAAVARGWKTQSRLDFIILALAVTVLGLVAVAMFIPHWRNALRRRWGHLLLITTTTAVSWLAAEAVIALRIP